MRKHFYFLFPALFFLLGHARGADLRIPAIFSDNMVVQAGVPVTISGHATPFQQVRIRMGKLTGNTTAGNDGAWSVQLPALSAGAAVDMEIAAGKEKIYIRNVLAGEVWLCSGQSNMEMAAGRTDVKDAIPHAPLDGIRYFIDQTPPSATPSDDKMEGHWVVCNPGNADRCSAVALSFALHLQPRLTTPVGLIINAKGGTPIESWTNLDTLQTKDYDRHIFQEREQWKKDRNKYELQYQKAKDSAMGAKIFPPFQLRENWNPASQYNSLIYPIRRLAFKGVIWYQGESNANYPFIYRYQLADMIRSWRNLLDNPDLPFFIIQLPEYQYKDANDWATLRESQASVTSMKNVWLVSSLGLGDTANIHPVTKMELGQRVALQVLAKAYHHDTTPVPAADYDMLRYKDIQQFTTGAFRIDSTSEGFVFNRYPENAIRVLSPSMTWTVRAHCTSGVTLSFITNSEKLFLSGKVIRNSPQTEPFHVLCNGHTIDVLPEKTTDTADFSAVLYLPREGRDNEIQIVFPAYSKGIISHIGLQKGSSLKNKICKGKLLAYGNSISQMGGACDGFLRITAANLGYSLYDAGIGGHIFQEKYLTEPLTDSPSIILVEYGTNDWSGGKSADSARPFLTRLCKLYPRTPVMLIEPLYRFRPAGADDSLQPALNKTGKSLEAYRAHLKNIAAEFQQVTFLDHKTLLPKDPGLYIDGVHPNQEGQRILAAHLTPAVAAPPIVASNAKNQAPTSRAAPNVIFILADDQGYGDIACNGNPWIKTPNIDRLAEEGLRFTDFHTGTTCAPSRAGLMTGIYCNRTGVWHTVKGRSILRNGIPTIAEMFRSAGYTTGIFGKWHLGDNYPYRPQDRGFDETLVCRGGGVGQSPDYWNNDYFGDTYFHNGKPQKFKEYCTEVWFDNAIRFIETAQKEHKPFFCYIPVNVAHEPYHVAQRYIDLYTNNSHIPYPAFYGMITNLDENLGRLREKLKALGLADNTILIYSSDNGSSGIKNVPGGTPLGFNAGMKGKKGSPYEGGHREPLYIYWKDGQISGARTITQLTSYVDFVPTLLDLCHIPAPDNDTFDGISLVPLLYGHADSWPDRILFTDTQREEFLHKWTNACVMTGQWRLVTTKNKKELYDIQQDPGEITDMAATHPDVVRQLSDAYEKYWRQTAADSALYVRIPIGAGHGPEVTELSSMDCHMEEGIPAWNQVMIRNGAPETGRWALDIARPGNYTFRIRRYPAESRLAINAAAPAGDTVPGDAPYPTGKILRLQKASLSIQGIHQDKMITPGAQDVEFTLTLKKGPAFLEARFTDDTNRQIDAYYVYVKRINHL